MKNILSTITVFATLAVAAAMPRSEWHALVGDCAQDSAKLKQVIAQLSPDDQKAFLAEVNAALAQMPGSAEAKAARFLDANKAAVSGVSKENRLGVLAEVFATVPPEYLTEINERFADELFSRSADASRTYTDAEYAAIAEKSVAAINERCATADNGAVRTGFAALMFIRASGGSPADLKDTLAAQLPESSQAVAKNEWFPAALGEGQAKSYDPMLGASQAGEEPDHAVVVQVYGPQLREALLGELATQTKAGITMKDITTSAVSQSATGFGAEQYSTDSDILQVPRMVFDRYVPPNTQANPSDTPAVNPYYGGRRRGGSEQPSVQPSEPRHYPYE